MEHRPIDAEPWAIEVDDDHIMFFLDGGEGDGKVLTNRQAKTLADALSNVLNAKPQKFPSPTNPTADLIEPW